MKKLTDKEIDHQLCAALASPPIEGLSMNFSAKLRGKLQERLQRENRIRFYRIWGLAFILGITVLFIGLQLIDQAYGTHVIRSVDDHKFIFILGFLLIFLIQYMDHTSIKEQQLRKYTGSKNSY